MAQNRVIDLDRQLIELLQKEEMLAYFDFTLRTASTEPASGICKISKPKEGESKSKYTAVLFIVDTPDEQAHKSVMAAFQSVNWDGFRSRLPGCKSVFPIPYMHLSSQIYFLEMDVYLSDYIEIGSPFVANKLLPAIADVVGIKPGELVFWEGAGGGEPDNAQPSSESLLQRLKRLLTS